MALPRIALIFGGPSSEHEVSKATAEQIMAVMNPAMFEVSPIYITRDEIWRIYPSMLALAADTPQVVISTDQAPKYLPFHFDAAFIALHGKFGEDGTIQRWLDRSGVPYQGSGPRASAVAFDKAMTQQRLRRVGLPIPEYAELTRAGWVAARSRKVHQLMTALGSDLVIKPNSEGSSVGVRVSQTPAQLADAMEYVSTHFDTFIVQKYIHGTEVTCSVVEFDDGMAALPPTLIRPKNAAFFDYESKYTTGATEEITPAPLPPDLIAQIQATALKAHRSLGLRDYSRTDMIVSKGRVWLLETNTLPGMTATSLLPQQAAAFGVSFPELIQHLTERALTRPEVIELS